MEHTIFYEGCFNTDIRANLLEVLFTQNGCKEAPNKDIRKHFSVAVEMLDNAQRYSSTAHVRFEWQNREDGIFIKIVNHANKYDAENLLFTLDRIRKMDPVELKSALLEQLSNSDFGDKGGAGLGFLQIANRSGAHVNAHIEPVNDHIYKCESTFTLKRA